MRILLQAIATSLLIVGVVGVGVSNSDPLVMPIMGGLSLIFYVLAMAHHDD